MVVDKGGRCGCGERSQGSTRGEWSGDVDLNDGYVKSIYIEYQDQL